ncbi:hypothetical protein QEN19_001447 [Hanseniaspora menglaensis]
MNNIIAKYFDPLNIFDNIRLDIQKHFPKKNIHYKRFAEDNVSTIRELDIKISNDDTISNDNIFFSNIVVTCTNIDEYRGKIRPLIRQWISNNSNEIKRDYHLGILFIQRTSNDISDKKLFNKLNLIEKIEKDFPEIKPENIFQFPNFYKSTEDKNHFYSRYILKLQKQVIDSLNLKLQYAEEDEDSLYIDCRSLDLYLKFGIIEFSEFHLQNINSHFIENLDFLQNLKLGDLQAVDFENFNSSNVEILSLNQNITYISLLDFRLKAVLKLLKLKHQPLLNSDIVFLHKSIIENYLSPIKKAFSLNENLNKFLYSVIDEIFMELPLITSNLDRSSLGNEVNKKEWYLLLGNLASIKRHAWMNMIDSAKLLPFQLNDNPTKHAGLSLVLINELEKTQEEILNKYINLTQKIISYWKDLKPITIDLLSSEIGLTFNKFNLHEKTIAILHSTFEYYYNVMKWEDLSIQILEVYIDSLEKLQIQDENQKIIIEDQLIPIVTVLANSYLNFTCLVKSNSSFRTLKTKLETWSKFLKLNSNTDLTYPLDRLIDLKVDLVPKLGYDLENKCHFYYINVGWEWLIDSQIILNLDLVKLKARNKNYDQILVFEALNTKLTDKNDLMLKCYDIVFGECEFVSIELLLSKNNTIFIKEFDDILKMNIVPLSDPNKVEISLHESSKRKNDEISLNVEYLNIKDSDELLLDFEIIEPTTLLFKDNKRNRIKYNEKSPLRQLNFELSNRSEILSNLKIKLNLLSSLNGKFKEKKVIECLFSNPLIISASIIEKQSNTYVNVSIDGVYEPFNIFSTSLVESTKDDDTINTFLSPNIKNIVLPGNPLSSFKNFFSLYKTNHSAELIYQVQYQTLRTAIRGFLKKKFLKLYPHLVLYVKVWEENVLPNLEFHTNQFIHFRTIKLKVYDELNFNELLKVFLVPEDPLNKEFLVSLLKIYRNLFEGIQLEESDSVWDIEESQIFTKSISFECDKILDLFTVELKKIFSETNLKMGECYKFQLIINKKQTGINRGQKDVYECIVLENLDKNDWLIGGFNKFYLDSQKTNEVFEINLIPIKRGYLKYPNIHITKCVEKNTESIISTHTTDFINVNENIIII